MLSPDGAGARLEADLPVADLEGAARPLALCPAPKADERRFLALPVALRAGAGWVQVVRPAGPGVVTQLADGARQVLGRVHAAAVARIKAWRA
jgi:hypothetical protein